MNDFYTTLAISLAIAIISIEYLVLGYRLKILFKVPLSEIKKPFDCRFCLYFWVMNTTTLLLSFLTTYKETCALIAINIIIAQLIENYYDKERN